MSIKFPQILVIVGPTSSGKTSLSIKLAKKFDGEVISADSRQVYKGMNLGTGKVTKKEMQGIKHYLLDVALPTSQFNAAKFERLGSKAIKEILRKGKLPIICGGTGFYVDALLYGLASSVAPDWKLRKKLDKLSTIQLFNKLRKIWPQRAANIDSKNKRRLIRALELALSNQKPTQSKINKYDTLKLGIIRKDLRQRIHERLLSRIKQGMIKEVATLHRQGVSWSRLDDFGLEYRFVSRYLRGILNREEMLQQLDTAIWHYAKRQMTWFKKDKEIHWLNNEKKAIILVKGWLS